jgi:hypothetical protein
MVQVPGVVSDGTGCRLSWPPSGPLLHCHGRACRSPPLPIVEARMSGTCPIAIRKAVTGERLFCLVTARLARATCRGTCLWRWLGRAAGANLVGQGTPDPVVMAAEGPPSTRFRDFNTARRGCRACARHDVNATTAEVSAYADEPCHDGGGTARQSALGRAPSVRRRDRPQATFHCRVRTVGG